MSASNGVIISQVSFGEGGLEIVYIETQDQSPKVGLIKTLIYEIEHEDQPRVDDILDSLEELLDEALIKLRNPQRRRNAKEVARDIGRAADASNNED